MLILLHFLAKHVRAGRFRIIAFMKMKKEEREKALKSAVLMLQD